MHKKRIFKFFRNAMAIALAVSMLSGEIGTSLGTVYASGNTQVQEVSEPVTENEEVVSETSVNSSSEYGLVDNIQDGTILHCFDWKYTDIIAELPNIAEAGFSTVQTSPAQTGGGGDVWYMLYQPLGFYVGTNELGTKDELTKLCSEAEKYGIKVIVDVVANHLAGDHTYIQDDLKDSQYWHNSNYNSDGSNGKSKIDWTNRWQVTHGDIGMPDLNSENSYVQQTVASYVKELKGIGVDGIRWDAAKHISLPSEDCDFWKAVTQEGLYNYAEILEGPTDAVDSDESKSLMKEYTNYVSVTDNGYGNALTGNFRDGTIYEDNGKWTNKGVSADKLVYWGESHDTYANDVSEGGWTKYLDQNIIDRSYAVVAARKDATALYFSRPSQTEKTSIKSGAKGSTHFTSPEVAAVNHFKNSVVGENEYYVADKSAGAIAVCRESGAVIVKASGSGQVTIANGGGTTAPGTYTDEVSGTTWTVTSTTITGSVNSSGIAVIYTPKAQGPSVTASVSSGSSFSTDTLDVTFSLSNATSGTYSINGGAATEFTNSAKVTLGADTAFGESVSVTVVAKGSDGTTVEKTFTYNKKEAGKVEKNTVYFTKPSGWSTPCIYSYTTSGGNTVELTGSWDTAVQMNDEGDGVYSYTFDDSVTTCNVIFKDGSNQIPAQDEAGFVYNNGKAYQYVTSWTEVEVPTATVSPTPTNTVTPTPTVTVTPIPDTPSVEASMKDGESFYTETATVKLTLKNAEKGYYSVDDGPVKEFTDSVDVVIGKGKIADSDVTLKVTVVGEDGVCVDEAFVYRKVYVTDVDVPQVNSGAEETVVEEAEVNVYDISGSPTTKYFQTNPSGQTGSKKTITSASDFTEDMIIAQGVANDSVSIFRGSHEGPVYDSYAMFGAYDDNNVYIGVQYVNVIDVVDPAQNYPISDNGKPYAGKIPQMMVFDTGSGDYTDGTANDTTQKTAWDIDVKYAGDAKVDMVYAYAAKYEENNKALYPVTDGIVDYTKVMFSKEGTDSGITYEYEDGFFCSTMYGIKDNGYSGYVPTDLNDESSNWIDFLTTSHDTSKDTFMIMTIPMSALGVTADQVAANGIGVMSISTFGESGIGSIPQDLTMLDNVSDPYVSKKGDTDESTSLEKADSDVVTVKLARLGGSADTTPTPNLTVTATPTETPTPTVETTVTPTPVPITGFHVNFGADRSAPQYNTTELTIEAIAAGGTEPYSYEFFVDGNSVQQGESSTYTWKDDTEGAHKIKVVVTDSTGETVTCEKDYDLEKDGEATPTPTQPITGPVTPSTTITPSPTPDPNPSVTPELTDTPTPTPVPSLISITKFLVSCKTADGSCKVGDEIVLRADTTNANGTPQYMFTYIVDGKEIIAKNYGPENEASFVAEVTGTYKFKVYVVDDGNEYSPEFETGEITVVAAATATPTPTQGAEATATPAVTVTATPTPTETPLISGVPVPTATPTPTQEATPTPTEVVTATPTVQPTDEATPTPTEGATATPTEEATPTPTTGVTVAPSLIVTATATPIPTATAAPTATKAPTATATATPVPTKKVTPVPTVVVAPEKGMVIVDEATGCDYTVTATGSSKTVEVTQYAGTSTSVVIPDVIKIGNDDYKVTAIADNAFKNNKKIKVVTIGANVTKIGKSAFYGCTALQKVQKGANVKTIGDKAFYGCKKLTSITLSSKLTTIGKYAFYKCASLKKITIPSKVSKIGTKAFYGCKKLKTITIKTTKLKSSKVGKQAFKGIYSKATIKVPKSKLNSYKKLLKSKGVSSKAKIKK